MEFELRFLVFARLTVISKPVNIFLLISLRTGNQESNSFVTLSFDPQQLPVAI